MKDILASALLLFAAFCYAVSLAGRVVFLAF